MLATALPLLLCAIPLLSISVNGEMLRKPNTVKRQTPSTGLKGVGSGTGDLSPHPFQSACKTIEQFTTYDELAISGYVSNASNSCGMPYRSLVSKSGKTFCSGVAAFPPAQNLNLCGACVKLSYRRCPLTVACMRSLIVFARHDVQMAGLPMYELWTITEEQVMGQRAGTSVSTTTAKLRIQPTMRFLPPMEVEPALLHSPGLSTRR